VAKSKSTALDSCFHALSHPIRREILDQLVKGPATVGAVSRGFQVAAPTISKHLGVLEDAGLITRVRLGREQRLTLKAVPLQDATSWLARYSRFWDERLDALDELVARLDDEDARARSKERKR
jgi:DNA-binding transcriptional ArsR family regulator